MRSKAIFMASLALAFGASAAPVSVEQARSAARAWVYRGDALGVSLGAVAERATVHRTSAGVGFYVVKMSGGGTVFMSADTEIEPVIAFTAENVDLSQVDKASPLWALLERDLPVRMGARPSASVSTASGSAAGAAASEESRLWAALVEEGRILESGLVSFPSRAGKDGLGSGRRAGPLVKSKWNQSTAGGKNCYNYFTPELSTGSRAVCGCVATAMSQVMRYHEFPTAPVAQVTRKCTVEAKTRGKAAAVNLTTQGGTYDWAKMTLEPGMGITDAECKAIGKLTSDAGITVCMNYDTDANGGSGSFMFNVSRALKDVFGYASADYYTQDEISTSSPVMQKAMFSNFDAGYPVLMGIQGDGGHAIVGDGYGYSEGKPYVHLNMGWSGSSDMWYNLPNIGTSYAFDVFDDLVFNIFPAAATEGSATVSGRMADDDGLGVSNALVRVLKAGMDEQVTAGVTSETGVYGFLVPVGTYDVEIAAEGFPVETLEGVVAPKTYSSTKSFWGKIAEGWTEEYKDVPYVTGVGSVGNVWGKDGVLTMPKARVVVGDVTNVYSTLDKAIAGAKAVSAANPTIEILEPIELGKSATVDFTCRITATNDDPSMTAILRSGNARLDVAAGGTLALSNLTFGAAASMAVDVRSGGRLVLSEKVSFGVPPTIAAVHTASADGFVLTAGLTEGFSIDCTAAKAADDVFGRATCDYLTASNCAALVANYNDARGETRGTAVEDGGIVLKWAEVPVPLSESAGYYVGADGRTNTAARLDRLLEKYALDLEEDKILTREIVVLDMPGQTLTQGFTVDGELTIRGEGVGAVISDFSSSAGFLVPTGAVLTVRNITFDGYTGNALFCVSGGTLNLEGGTKLHNISGTNTTHSGAVAVESGTNVVGSADGIVEFANCVNPNQGSCGGAIYLKGPGCELVLQDRVVITNCSTRKNGGGVFVQKGAVAKLSGYLTITNNVSGSTRIADDIYYFAATNLIVNGKIGTGSEVGLRSSSSLKPANGVVFASVTASAADALDSCPALFSDVKTELSAVPSQDSQLLLWEIPETGGIKPVSDPSAAVARIVGEGTNGYPSLEDAFEILGEDGVIEVLRDTEMVRDVAVSNKVILKSGPGGPFTVTRAAPCKFSIGAGGVLTNADITVSGRLDDERGGEGLLFDVKERGGFVLADGAVISNVVGGAVADRASSAIKIYKGDFTMLKGSAIRNCSNSNVANNRGGAVTADSLSTVSLLGGVIEDCVSDKGGAVYVGNESVVSIGGDFTAVGNTSSGGSSNNLYVVYETCDLRLVSELTGHVGYLSSTKDVKPVFGQVVFSAANKVIANSAHNFTHDQTGDVGLAVRNGSETLLVWSDAVDANGHYTDGEKDYAPVSGGETIRIAVPEAIDNLVYNGVEQNVEIPGHGFTVVSGVTAATVAGDYVARVKPKAGFAWEDGTTAEKEVSWRIGKATHDMSDVTFRDRTFVYDGKSHSIAVAGKVPLGVEVVYAGDPTNRTEVGTNVVTASFNVLDTVNYEQIETNMTAKLIITCGKPVPPPGPEYEVTTNDPSMTPLAFSAIERVAETEWKLSLTNLLKDAEYALSFTEDLTTPFTTGQWFKASASGPWTTNVQFSSEDPKPAYFWRAHGRTTYMTNWLNAVPPQP